MKSIIKRKPQILLPLSVRFAEEYFYELCKMQKVYSQDQLQESKELTIRQRALWTALIVEIGRLFDTYKRDGKGVISFKQLPRLKNEVANLHGEAIIGKVLATRKTFTGHFAENGKEIVSVSEICESKLGKVLKQLKQLSVTQ